MRKIVLTGLGNEVDISTGKTLFTAIFNGDLRVQITEEGARVLTQAIYGDTNPTKTETPSEDEHMKPDAELSYDTYEPAQFDTDTDDDNIGSI
jgi:hypothetical protein